MSGINTYLALRFSNQSQSTFTASPWARDRSYSAEKRRQSMCVGCGTQPLSTRAKTRPLDSTLRLSALRAHPSVDSYVRDSRFECLKAMRPLVPAASLAERWGEEFFAVTSCALSASQSSRQSKRHSGGIICTVGLTIVTNTGPRTAPTA